MNDSIDTTSNRLLIVDDEPAFGNFVASVGEGLGFDVLVTERAEEFLQRLSVFKPTALVLDLNMPGTDGVELLRSLATAKFEGAIVLISGEDGRVLNTAERLGRARGLNMAATTQKPVLLPDLKDILERVRRFTIQASDLQRALDAEELEIHYQPQLSRTDGEWRVTGAEALLRWQHPELGMIMPSEFLPVAEKADRIRELTDYVLRHVVRQIRQWRERELMPIIAANVGPHLLDDVGFPDQLEALLAEYDVAPTQLTLEITEGTAIADAEHSLDIFARLRLRGIGLALDDFGTGYSTLNQLFNMPFSELKLDGSFVKEVGRSEEARTIVKTMVQLAHNLNVTACAEYVADLEVLAFLEECGCDKVQGFLFSEPVTAEAFEAYCRSETPFTIRRRA